MTTEEKKAYLSRYIALEALIERRLAEIDRLCRMERRLKEPAARQIRALNGEINREGEALVRTREEIVHAIANVWDPACRRVLECRYLDGCSWQETAEQMHYSLMQAQRIHKRALEEVRIGEDEAQEPPAPALPKKRTR